MRAAAALEAGQRLLDLRVARFFGPLEERGRGHDPAVEAVAALLHLFFDEGLLHRVRLLRRAEASQGDDLAIAHGRERRHTGAHGLPVHVHGARAALRQPAAKMWIVERELVAQRVEQRHVRVGIDRVDLAVHIEIYSGHEVRLSLAIARGSWARIQGQGASLFPGTVNAFRVRRLVQRASIGNSLAALVVPNARIHSFYGSLLSQTAVRVSATRFVRTGFCFLASRNPECFSASTRTSLGAPPAHDAAGQAPRRLASHDAERMW